ncbi:hypothetical protein Tco_1114419 [Tanacetum coccineum]|uniref:Uncharacterized protein n=1 Tax=Tanacetum coccineum TaxID=301880 RepID=A0ABQ5IVG5_9ASTR
MKDPASSQGEKPASDLEPSISAAIVIHSMFAKPSSKKPKVVIDIPIPAQTPLNSIRPTIIENIPYKKDDKGKGIAHTIKEDQLNQLMPLLEEGGSDPKLPNLQQFSTAREAEEEKSEKKLKRVMTSQELKAQVVELAAYEAKRAKIMDKYNHCINFRDDPLPITKFSYRVNNSTKEATRRIIRNNQPLNLMVYAKFLLKKLGFTEWLEVYALASRTHTKSNDQLLKNLKAKFQWVATQVGKLGVPSSP